MPLQKLQFRPGLNREGTDYSNEGGWYDGDKVRFRSGFPEKLGGWIRFSTDTFVGIARSLWNWVDLNSNNYVGVGTSKKYYVAKGGTYNDITPIFQTNTLALNPLATTIGQKTVIVTDAVYRPNTGDYVIFSGATAVGGITVNGEYSVTATISTTEYMITTITTASSTATGGGAAVVAQYEYPSGLDVNTNGNGWGAGAWSPTIPKTLSANPFATTNASGTITVTHTAHGLTTGNYVYFTGALATGGIPASVLNNTYPITVVNANSYTILTPGNTSNNSNAGTVLLASSTTTGGGVDVIVYPQSGVRGWGDGAINTVATQLRLWTNDNYGQNLFIAPRGGQIYYWLPAFGTGTRAQSLATLASSVYVPTTTYQILSSAIQKFVVAFGANPYVSGTPYTPFNPMLVRWSDQADELQWVPSITNQAGEFALTNGSYIMGARATRQEILVWTDSCLYSMQYLGAPYVWGFQILMDNISIMSPNAMVTVNNVTYWMGTEKFYMYSGRVETLPCSLRQYIFDDINQNQNYQVFAGANEGYNEVWWYYVSNGDSADIVNKYVIYNYLDRTWYYGNLSRTSWLQTGIQQYPLAASYIPSCSFVGSIDGTTLTVTNVFSGSLTLGSVIEGANITNNTVISSFDTGTGYAGTYTVSNAQVVGSETMTISGNYGRLLYHENGVDDVSGLFPVPIASYIQSSDFDIGDGHNFGFVWRILPDINFNGSTVNNPSVKLTVKPRQNSGTPYGLADSPQVQSQNNYSTRGVYTVQLFDGQVYTRLRGRQLAFRIESSTLGVSWQLGSPRIDIRNDGRR